jgi:small subunit ribosomal protein S20
MPNTAQAAKRLRQSVARAEHNKSRRSRLRTEIKKFTGAIHEHNARRAEAQLRVVMSLLDKAAKTRLIHHNEADRRKSRLSRQLYTLQHRHDEAPAPKA